MATVAELPIGTRVVLRKAIHPSPSSMGIVVGNSVRSPLTSVIVEFDNGVASSIRADALKIDNLVAEELQTLQSDVNDKIADAIILLRDADVLVRAQNRLLKDKSIDSQEYDFSIDVFITCLDDINLTAEVKKNRP